MLYTRSPAKSGYDGSQTTSASTALRTDEKQKPSPSKRPRLSTPSGRRNLLRDDADIPSKPSTPTPQSPLTSPTNRPTLQQLHTPRILPSPRRDPADLGTRSEMEASIPIVKEEMTESTQNTVSPDSNSRGDSIRYWHSSHSGSRAQASTASPHSTSSSVPTISHYRHALLIPFLGTASNRAKQSPQLTSHTSYHGESGRSSASKRPKTPHQSISDYDVTYRPPNVSSASHPLPHDESNLSNLHKSQHRRSAVSALSDAWFALGRPRVERSMSCWTPIQVQAYERGFEDAIKSVEQGIIGVRDSHYSHPTFVRQEISPAVTHHANPPNLLPPIRHPSPRHLNILPRPNDPWHVYAARPNTTPGSPDRVARAGLDQLWGSDDAPKPGHELSPTSVAIDRERKSHWFSPWATPSPFEPAEGPAEGPAGPLASGLGAHKSPSLYHSKAISHPYAPNSGRSIMHDNVGPSDHYDRSPRRPARPPSSQGSPSRLLEEQHSTLPHLGPGRGHRQLISCYPCRAKKLKCDGRKPCIQCCRRGEDEQCTFAQGIRRRGKARRKGSGGESSSESTGKSVVTGHGEEKMRSGQTIERPETSGSGDVKVEEVGAEEVVLSRGNSQQQTSPVVASDIDV